MISARCLSKIMSGNSLICQCVENCLFNTVIELSSLIRVRRAFQSDKRQPPRLPASSLLLFHQNSPVCESPSQREGQAPIRMKSSLKIGMVFLWNCRNPRRLQLPLHPVGFFHKNHNAWNNFSSGNRHPHHPSQ